MSLLAPGRIFGILALVAGVAACMGDDDDPLTSGSGESTSSSSGGRASTPPTTSSSSSSGGAIDACVPETGADDAATDAHADGAHDS